MPLGSTKWCPGPYSRRRGLKIRSCRSSWGAVSVVPERFLARLRSWPVASHPLSPLAHARGLLLVTARLSTSPMIGQAHRGRLDGRVCSTRSVLSWARRRRQTSSDGSVLPLSLGLTGSPRDGGQGVVRAPDYPMILPGTGTRMPRSDDHLPNEPPSVGRSHRFPRPVVGSPLEELLNWLYRGWSIVSLGLLVVMLMVVIDSRRAARLLRQVGLGDHALHPRDAGGLEGGVAEYDPALDGGYSGGSEASSTGGVRAGTPGAGGRSQEPGKGIAAVNGGVAKAPGVKGEVRVGCLTVSDTVLGYGSHGTVVYRGLLEGRPVAVKRMLTDFHARADREISLLIESDG